MVNTVVTPRNVYIDTPSTERVGPVAGLAGWIGDRNGLTTPRQIPRASATVRQVPQQRRVHISAPGAPSITGKTDAYVGRPSQLSPGGQLRHAWNLLRR
jgi:hypothetical protein